MTPACSTCPFWECPDADRKDAPERRCIVRSPAAYTSRLPDAGPPRNAVWPWTLRDESCGEHPARQRDRLAAMAMQGIVTFNGNVDRVDLLARDAYEIADAMLAEREKEPTP